MPRYDMPRAAKNLFVRIILIFLTSCILISVLVPYTEPLLLGTSNVAASPFVIAMGYAGIPVLPHIINVVLLICLCGIGSESLFIASRIQTAMAKMGMMPQIFGKIDDQGRPVWSLAACSLVAIAMTYMCVSTTGAIAFNWFSSISATTTFFAWMVRHEFQIPKVSKLTHLIVDYPNHKLVHAPCPKSARRSRIRDALCTQKSFLARGVRFPLRVHTVHLRMYLLRIRCSG
jgi:amino acid permease